MAKKEVEEDIVEDGTPAVFLRKVDVVIQNGDEEPIVIKAEEQPAEQEEK